MNTNSMKHNYLFLLILTVVFAIVYVRIFDPKLDLNGDNARYIQLAKNISAGLGYNNESINGLTPEGHFPPGYPAFLSAFMSIGINNLIFFKVLNGILLFLSLALLFYLVRKITDNAVLAFTVSLLPLFCPQLLHFSTIVMSEMLFLFLSVMCLFALFRYTGSSRNFWKSPWFYFAVIAAGISYYVRATGYAVVFGLLLFFLFRKEWKQLLASLFGCILIIIPWMIRGRELGGNRYLREVLAVNIWRPEEGSISTVGDFLWKVGHNFDESIIKGTKEILFPFIPVDYNVISGFLGVVGGLLILVVIFYGAWRLKPLRWAVIGYIVGTVGMVSIGTGGNGSRYIVPVAPVLFVCFYVGIYYMVKQFIVKKESPSFRSFPYAFLLIAMLMFPSLKTMGEMSKQPYPPAYQNFFVIAKEMQRQLPPRMVCCSRKPELFNYFADKMHAVNYKYTTDCDELLRDLIDKKVDFVILEQLGYSSTQRYLYPAIEANPELFPVVWHLPNPDTYLLRFDRQKAERKTGKPLKEEYYEQKEKEEKR